MSGGHADYAGNEINAIQLNVANPQWIEKKAPSPLATVYSGSPFYSDLRGASAHSYYLTHFIDARDKFIHFSNGGCDNPFAWPLPPGGWPYPRYTEDYSPCFDWNTTNYDAPTFIPAMPSGVSNIAAMCCRNPTTGDVYLAKGVGGPYAGWLRWTQSTNTWTVMSSQVETNYCGSAVDPTRNRILIIGDYRETTNPRVRDFSGTAQSVTFGGLGVAALKGSGSKECGVVYDEANDTFLMITNTDSIGVKRVRAWDWFVDVPTITGTPPARRQNGIQNSVQYVPELKGIVIANSYTGNLYFMRTAL